MTDNKPRIALRDSLPDIYRADDIDGTSNRFVTTFLGAFDALFEELQSKIEGTPAHVGGIPALFHPDTLAQEFGGAEDKAFAYLEYLAGWIGLSLRREKSLKWNRQFFRTALTLYPSRGTRDGLEAMLRAWLQGDLLETLWPDAHDKTACLPLVQDLIRSHPESDTLFQIRDQGATARLGIDTALGEGPPFFFLVDLTLMPPQTTERGTETDQSERATEVDQILRAARQLLDAEKPAHTYYQLRVRAQLTSDGPFETWIVDSDA